MIWATILAAFALAALGAWLRARAVIDDDYDPIEHMPADDDRWNIG